IDDGVLLDQPQCPEVIREISIEQVAVRHCEVALDAPSGSPRIANDESSSRVLITYRTPRVAAEDLFPGLGHRDDTSLRDLVPLKAFINRKPVHEGITRRETALHLALGPRYSRVLNCDVFLRFGVALWRWLQS